MKIVRNETPAPMTAPKPGRSLVTLTLRFAVLLIIAIVLMALAWSR